MSFILRTNSEAIGVGADPEALRRSHGKRELRLLMCQECRWEEASHTPGHFSSLPSMEAGAVTIAKDSGVAIGALGSHRFAFWDKPWPLMPLDERWRQSQLALWTQLSVLAMFIN